VTTWLIDTALFKALAPGRAPSVRQWLETNEASIFLSVASVVELNAAIARMFESQKQRREAMRAWLDGLVSAYVDRIHPVDVQIALRAGALMPNLRDKPPRHRFHDATLVATAQIHGHGLLTRRDTTFGPWTEVPIEIL
jgi:predicted nucleic acid-binding protein